MTKMTETAIARKICRGELEIEDRSGQFAVLRDCKTDRCFPCRVIG
jgi:hypothetical protein